jgi:hypothetical protein
MILKINLISLPTETVFYIDVQSNLRKLNLLFKQKKPFDKLEVTQFVNNRNKLEKALKTFKIITSENNERTVNFEKGKNDAIRKLKKYFERLSQLKNERTNIKKDIENVRKKSWQNESAFR